MVQLKVAFEKKFLVNSRHNEVKALKQMRDELMDQADIMAAGVYSRQLDKKRKPIDNVLRGADVGNFKSKQVLVDKMIEKDIIYFTSGFAKL